MNPPESAANIAWRLAQVERAAEKLDGEKADTKDVANVLDRVNALGFEVNGLRRALLIFSLSMVGTAVSFLGIIFVLVSTNR
jgi:hypothetical protein